MNTYNIEIQEILSKVVEVKAYNFNDAVSIVEDDYKKCIHVLDYNDFVEVNFLDINCQTNGDRKEELIKEVINYLYKDEEKHYEEFEEKPKDHIFIKLRELKELLY